MFFSKSGGLTTFLYMNENTKNFISYNICGTNFYVIWNNYGENCIWRSDKVGLKAKTVTHVFTFFIKTGGLVTFVYMNENTENFIFFTTMIILTFLPSEIIPEKNAFEDLTKLDWRQKQWPSHFYVFLRNGIQREFLW